MNLGTKLTRAAACATLTAMLAGAVYAESIFKRPSPVSDEQISAMLTTRNETAVNQYLSIGFRDVFTVIAPLFKTIPEDAGSEFRFATFNKKGKFTGIEKKTYAQYGNPLGVLTPAFGDDFDASDRFYLTTLAENAIEAYEADLDRMRSVGLRHGVDVEEYLRPFRIDTPLPAPGNPVQQMRALVYDEPIGAIQEGLIIDRRGNYLGEPAARIIFAFAPEGKQPLYCQAVLPYKTDSAGRHYYPRYAAANCTLDGERKRIVTSWDEADIELAKAAGKPNRMMDGFCGADCAGRGGAAGFGSASGMSDGSSAFGSSSTGHKFP